MPYLIFGTAVLLLLLLLAAAFIFSRRGIPAQEMPPPAVPEYDAGEAERAAEALSEAIQCQTVSYKDVTRRDFTQWVDLRKVLRERFPLCHEHMEPVYGAGFSSFLKWASPNPASEPVLLCAHLDVVPADGVWRVPPFEGRVEGGFVWGRGALDCKNVVVCLFMALESLFERGFVPGCDIYLALGHDEELGGGEGAKQIARHIAQQGLRFSLVLDEGGFITDAAFPVGKPIADVCAAEKGYMDIRLSVSDTGGHSSCPPPRTAADLICEAVCRINFQPRPASFIPLISDGLKVIAPWLDDGTRRHIAHPKIFGGRMLSRFCGDRRTAALVRTTVATTMLGGGVAPNVLPSSAEAVVNVRLLPGDEPKAILSWISALTRDLGVRAEVLTEESASPVSDYTGEVFMAISAIISETFPGIPAVPGLYCGATDARHYAHFADTVLRFSPFILTPDELATVHAENERVAVASLGAAARFYRKVVERFCTVDSGQLIVDSEETTTEETIEETVEEETEETTGETGDTE